MRFFFRKRSVFWSSEIIVCVICVSVCVSVCVCGFACLLFECASLNSRTLGATCDEQAKAYANTDNNQMLPNLLADNTEMAMLPPAGDTESNDLNCYIEK